MPPVPTRLLTRFACVLLVCLASGCQRKGGERQQLVVFAAASLRESFEALSGRFEQLNPGVEVRLNTAGSQQLAVQLEHGATADLFASADPAVLERLAQSGHVGPGKLFARNALVIAVQPSNPKEITGLTDLLRVERVVLAAPEVPVGKYSRELLAKAELSLGAGFKERVEAKARSGELSTRQVLARVALGEADAGLVYRTDVAAAADVEAVEIPAALNVSARYAIAVPRSAPNPQLAGQFIALLLSPAGQAELERRGFLPAGTERAP